MNKKKTVERERERERGGGGGEQGFIQLNDVGGQRDPHLKITRGHRETLEGDSCDKRHAAK